MPAFRSIRPCFDTWSFRVALADRFGMVMAADGMVMGGDTWMGMDGMDGTGGDHWARASLAPANARHRAIEATAQAFHEGDRNLTSVAINLLDLPMDCSSKAAVLSMASTK